MVRMQEINEHLARENIVLKEKTGRSILMRRQTRIQRSVFHEWHRFAHNEAILRRERSCDDVFQPQLLFWWLMTCPWGVVVGPLD